MTSLTRYRRYPVPSNQREYGNGGLHSELLARAVALDLDVLDAAWAAELLDSTLINTLASDLTGISSGDSYWVLLDTVERFTNGEPGLLNAASEVNIGTPDGGGWYDFSVTLHVQSAGAITVNARHRMECRIYRPEFGTFTIIDSFNQEEYQTGSQDIYLNVGFCAGLGYGDFLVPVYSHTNASGANVKAAATRVSATKICGYS